MTALLAIAGSQAIARAQRIFLEEEPTSSGLIVIPLRHIAKKLGTCRMVTIAFFHIVTSQGIVGVQASKWTVKLQII